MKTDLFDYELPEHLIAREPTARRSQSRLLVLNKQTGALSHHRFWELGDLLEPGDLLVANHSRVFPARVWATKEGGGRVELLLLEPVGGVRGDERWRALARGARKLTAGQVLAAEGARIGVEGRDGQTVLLRIAPVDASSVLDWAGRVGDIPLPPYLKREAGPEDARRYQSVFAREPGSVAAPTAGLHFDEPLLERLEGRGIDFETLRLDVGWGTFAPIRAKDVREHRLGEERYEIPAPLAEKVMARRRQGPRPGRVVAVGTTSTRALEEAFASLPPHLAGRTGLYLTPGYRFHTVEALVTNFHLPRTSLLVLVCAFAGRQQVLAAYEEAIGENYRFYSYGDAMLIV